jgi:hypothetical protein
MSIQTATALGLDPTVEDRVSITGSRDMSHLWIVRACDLALGVIFGDGNLALRWGSEAIVQLAYPTAIYDFTGTTSYGVLRVLSAGGEGPAPLDPRLSPIGR